MTTFLERYQQGERETVWAELVALGEKVREEPYLSDAQAVARETMTRARTNVERIYERLQAIQYHFEFPQRAFVPPPADVRAQLDEFESLIGVLPLSLRAWCEIVGEVNFMGTYPMLSYYAPSVTPNFMSIFESGILESEEWKAKSKKYGLPEISPVFTDFMKQRLQREKQRPSYNLGPDAQVTADPLVVEALDALTFDEYETWQEDHDGMAGDDADFRISIAPDIFHKSNISGAGGYDIVLPNPAADAPLLEEDHHTTFVNYLRLSFQWGGFPGLADEAKRDQDILDRLKADLLPI